MPIVSDFHSHVSYSSAEAMLQAAQSKGLRVLGLSEHVFQMKEARPLLSHIPGEGRELSFPAYIEEVQAAARQSQRQCELRLGLEVDFIPDKNEAIQALVQGYPWDFLIGSVHEIDGVLFEEVSDWKSIAEAEAAWRRYLDLLVQAVTSGWFSVVSHPVRLFHVNQHLPSDLDDALEHLAAEAARCDVALEINGFDVANYPQMVRRLVHACARQRTPVSVGSDAHRPHRVAVSHVASEALLHEAGIRQVRTWRRLEAESYALTPQ